MTEKEDFVILRPYTPTDEEQLAIKTLANKPQGLVADDWKSRMRYVLSFKENLREYMYKEQNYLCAYCRIHVPSACVTLHIDHIAHKSKHPQWIFLPENLCVCCPKCNEYKGSTESLVYPQTELYPNNGDNFKIVHPLYDKYSDHIQLIGGILYHGRTDKGIFTIMTCQLYRVDLAIERAKQLIINKHNGSIIIELLKLIERSNIYIDDKIRLKEAVINIVKAYKANQNI